MARIKTIKTKTGLMFEAAGQRFTSYSAAQKHLKNLQYAAVQAQVKFPPPPPPTYQAFSVPYKTIPSFWKAVYGSPRGGKGSFVSFDIDNIMFEDYCEQLMSLFNSPNVNLIFCAVVEDADPQIWSYLKQDLDLRRFICPICNGTALNYEDIEKITSTAYQAAIDPITLFEDVGLECRTCHIPIGVSLYSNGILVDRFYKSKAKRAQLEYWYEWQGQYYQRQKDSYACPICDHTFTISEATCTQCAAQLGDYRKIFASLYLGDGMGRGWSTDTNGKWRAKATISWTPTIGAYKLHFEFVTKELIELLKMAIPSSDRSYDPKTKTWTFTENHFDFVKGIVDHKYNNVLIYEKAKIEAEYAKFENNVKIVDPKTLLGTFVKLVNGAGITLAADVNDGQLARKAYLRAAMFYHPDRNPERAKEMSTLNEAWTNLQEYFGLKNVAS